VGHGCGYIEGESDCGMCGKSNSPSGYRAELDEFSVSLPTYRKEGRGQEAYEWSQWMNRAGTITITPREMRDLFWKEENIVPISKYPPISSDAFYEILPAELAYIHVQQKPVLRILVRADANE